MTYSHNCLEDKYRKINMNMLDVAVYNSYHMACNMNLRISKILL